MHSYIEKRRFRGARNTSFVVTVIQNFYYFMRIHVGWEAIENKFG
jgi:hypothetical protein